MGSILFIILLLPALSWQVPVSGRLDEPYHEPLSDQPILHSAFFYPTLHPSTGMDGKTAFSLMSSLKSASGASTAQLRFFYWANIHLGLNWSDPKSSITAVRNCIRMNSTTWSSIVPKVLKIALPNGISACTREVLALTSGKGYGTDFLAGHFVPVPVGLCMAAAYSASAQLDPDYRQAMDDHPISRELEQAFFYQDVRMSLRRQLGEDGTLTSFEFPLSTEKNFEFSKLAIGSILASLNDFFPKSRADWMIRRDASRDVLYSLYPNHAQYSAEYFLLGRQYIEAIVEFMSTQDSQMAFDTFLVELKRLLGLGLDINSLGFQIFHPIGVYPVLRAISRGDTELIQTLVSYGFNINDPFSWIDYLLPSLTSDSLDMVQLLLDHGADANKLYGDYFSILHYAIQQRNSLPLVQLLVSYGADPTYIADSDQWHAVHVAAAVCNLPVLDYFLHEMRWDVDITGLKTQNEDSLFLLACQSISPESIIPYFLAGLAGSVDLEARNAQGQSCVDYLALNDHHQLIQEIQSIILYYGAIVEAKDVSLSSASSSYFSRVCRLSSNLEMMDILLKRGANIDAVEDPKEGTCLMHALRQRDVLMIMFLVMRGASIDQVRSIGQTHASHTSESREIEVGKEEIPSPVIVAAGMGFEFFCIIVQCRPQTGSDDTILPDALTRLCMKAAIEHNQTDVVDYLKEIIDKSDVTVDFDE